MSGELRNLLISIDNESNIDKKNGYIENLEEFINNLIIELNNYVSKYKLSNNKDDKENLKNIINMYITDLEQNFFFIDIHKKSKETIINIEKSIEDAREVLDSVSNIEYFEDEIEDKNRKEEDRMRRIEQGIAGGRGKKLQVKKIRKLKKYTKKN
jgi:hypothetical protein